MTLTAMPYVGCINDRLYGIETEEMQVFKTVNLIKENINKLELQAVLGSLHLLSADNKSLEINEEAGNLVVEIFFSSEAFRQAVQKAIIRQCAEYKVPDLDEWKPIFKGSLYGLKLSDLQTSLLLGRDPKDHYCFSYVQTILKKFKQLKARSLTGLPEEFLFRLCVCLPIKELGRFSRTCKKACLLINSKSDLIWLTVADNYKIKVNLQSKISIKEQLIAPWLEMPFGKIHQLTYEVILSKTYVLPELLGEDYCLNEKLLPIFLGHIPKEYYFRFELQDSKTSLILYRDESGAPQSELIFNRMTDRLAELTQKLSETLSLKCCTGKFESGYIGSIV